MENTIIFARPRRIGMETITLSYEPDSEFAAALDELISRSEGVRVVKRSKSKNTPKKRCALDEAIQEEKEGKVTTYSNIDELFADLGI